MQSLTRALILVIALLAGSYVQARSHLKKKLPGS